VDITPYPYVRSSIAVFKAYSDRKPGCGTLGGYVSLNRKPHIQEYLKGYVKITQAINESTLLMTYLCVNRGKETFEDIYQSQKDRTFEDCT
jgi:hypothetical protein